MIFENGILKVTKGFMVVMKGYQRHEFVLLERQYNHICFTWMMILQSFGT